MAYSKYLVLGIIAGTLILFSGCHSRKSDAGVPGAISQDTVTNVRTVSVVISTIPFPTNILDTLYNINVEFHNDLLDPVGNVNLYSESNAQAINLGLYGADLAYVISFEQFQSVGPYMKVTKFLADNIGIPLAFTRDVIERCEKNQNNKDSLTRIVLQSYNLIDQTLKQAERNAPEVLVLTGGWVEGVYLTSESLANAGMGMDKPKMIHILMQQKQYGDKLISLLQEVGTSSPYCKNLATHLQELGLIFDSIKSEDSFTEEKTKEIADKVSDIRSLIIKGNS